jgi:hypothetical protein
VPFCARARMHAAAGEQAAGAHACLMGSVTVEAGTGACRHQLGARVWRLRTRLKMMSELC